MERATRATETGEVKSEKWRDDVTIVKKTPNAELIRLRSGQAQATPI
jgi:hypothetical protein